MIGTGDGPVRLRQIPWARYCADHQEMFEKGTAPGELTEEASGAILGLLVGTALLLWRSA